MRSSLGVYVPKLVPRLIAVVESDAADRRVASVRASPRAADDAAHRLRLHGMSPL